MKIRSMQSPVYVEMFKSFGMLPTPMPSQNCTPRCRRVSWTPARMTRQAGLVGLGGLIKYYSLDEHSLTPAFC